MDLAELSDRQEIADLITRYTRAVDTGEHSARLALTVVRRRGRVDPRILTGPPGRVGRRPGS